ncbi:hypothetical protein Ancab_014255, partial [Ancistrocladus abbreviatus]
PGSSFFATFPTVYALVATSLVPPTVTPTLRPTTLMPDLATIESLTLDRLIDEVELVEHIDVLIKGDVADAEDKINDPIATKGGTHDHA